MASLNSWNNNCIDYDQGFIKTYGSSRSLSNVIVYVISSLVSLISVNLRVVLQWVCFSLLVNYDYFLLKDVQCVYLMSAT